jgi:hypothetical protein
MRRIAFALLGALALASVLSLATTAIAREDDHKDREGRTILEFDTMFPVAPPFLSSPVIRGVVGAGAAWKLTSVEGELKTNGKLEIDVRGLVLVSTGQNPAATFRGAVSCLTPDGAGGVATVNKFTREFPATPTGNAHIEDVIPDLPHPCVAPIVFVVRGNTLVWFAVTGN